MAKKSTKAWPAVQQFLSEKTTDNFLEILVAIKKGNLVEADRKSLGEIDPSDLILSDLHYPEFEKKFVDHLIDLRFDIDFEKLERYFETNKKEDEEKYIVQVESSIAELSASISEAIDADVEAQTLASKAKEVLVEASAFKDDVQSLSLIHI